MNNYQNTVIFFIDSFFGGGAERVVVDILNNWPQTKSNLEPILLVKSKTGPYKKYLNKKIKIITLKKPLMFRNIIYNGNEISNILKFYNVKAIVSHLVGNNRTILRLKLLGFIKIPIIVCEHNNISLQMETLEKNIFKRILITQEIKFLYKFANAIVSVSDNLKSQLIKKFNFPISNVFHIPNPIDFNYIEKMIKETPKDKFLKKFCNYKDLKIIVSVGRLSTQKNFSFLLDVCEELKKVDEKIKFVIFGEGNEQKNLEKKILSRGLKKYFELPGFTDNPWWYIYRSQLYVMCSLWEGYPLILNEAIACNTKIVSIDCDFGPREIIYDNVGRLVGNLDKKKFAEVVLEELQDSKAKKIDKFMKHRLITQSPKSISIQYSNLVEKVLANS